MLRPTANPLMILASIATLTFAVGMLGAAPAQATGRAGRSATPAAASVDPIVGAWGYQGGVIQVTGSESQFIGVITQATSFNQCTHAVGQRIWTIRGSNGSYSGTHIGVNLPDCTDLPMAANWSLQDNGDGTYSLRLCAEAGCATLHRAGDTTPPTILLEVPQGTVPLGRTFKVRWAVTDDSKEAVVTAVLYSGGTIVEGYPTSTDGLIQATGKPHESTVDAAPRNYPGPFYLCMSAQDAAGNESPNAPQSTCRWLSLQVSLAALPDTANGCGGAQWGEWAGDVQNWALDTQKYGGRTVNFRAACNQHDAGYAGVTVYDNFIGRIIDFRTWTRARVDEKFQTDLRTLCHKYLGDHVSARTMSKCTNGPSWADFGIGTAVTTSPGAITYYEGVRAEAQAAFDTDVTVSGTQTSTNPVTWPEGGGRNNT